MRNFKLCNILIAIVIMMAITSCSKKVIITPVVSIPEIPIMEKAVILPEPPITVVKIKEVFMFDHDSYAIPDEQIVKIDKIESLMKEYPDTVILIRGWASSEGDIETNQILSMNRADAIKFALTEAGIKESRIQAIGSGETKIFGKFLNLNRRVVVLDVGE